MKFKLHQLLSEYPKLKQLLIGVLTLVVVETIYAVIQHNTVGSTDIFKSPWDEEIPFIREWIWIYASILLVLVLAGATLEPDKFDLTLKRVIAAAIPSFFCFIIWPCDYPRPNVVDDGTLMGWGYSFMHSIDLPRNTFPSMHVSLTWIVVHEIYDTFPKRFITFAYAFVVTLSVLLTKQHFIADAVAGFAIYVATLFLPLARKQP